MTPIVQRLKDVKPDVLLAISFPNDAILFQRKAKELDFNVAAFIGVSAGYSSPDLRDSIGDMVNGIFVSDFAAAVNPKALQAGGVKVADEFFKRYERQDEAPARGPRLVGFSATWALFTEVFPKAKSLRAGELREIALKLDLPEGSLANGSGIKFTNNDWPQRSQGCRPEPARLDRRLAVAEGPATTRSSRRRWRPTSRSRCRCRAGASAERVLGARPRYRAARCASRLDTGPMTTVGQLVFSGILIGGIYALMSIGLTLIFGVLRVVNFAHGEFLMLAMYGAWAMTRFLGLNPYYSRSSRWCRPCSCSVCWCTG